MIVSVDDNPAWSTKNIAGVVTPEVNNVLVLIVNTSHNVLFFCGF
jgi:hypothetical protein